MHYTPFIAVLPKNLVCLSYANCGTIHVRVNDDGKPTHIVPRSGDIHDSTVYPSPLSEEVHRGVRALLVGEPPDLWFARGSFHGRMVSGLVKAECRVRVNGHEHYQVAILPVSPDEVLVAYAKAIRSGAHAGKAAPPMILEGATRAEPTAEEEKILERILKRLEATT